MVVCRTAKDKGNSIWTDGSRPEDGGLGVAAVWWGEEGTVTGRTYTPGWREAGWMCRRYHLGKNKEVFGAELYALYQASKTLDNRILSDSTAAIMRARSNTGPGQRFAIAIIEPGEHSDAKMGHQPLRHRGPRALDAVPGDYLRETSFAHITRMATKTRSAGAAKWVVTTSKASTATYHRRGRSFERS